MLDEIRCCHSLRADFRLTPKHIQTAANKRSRCNVAYKTYEVPLVGIKLVEWFGVLLTAIIIAVEAKHLERKHSHYVLAPVRAKSRVSVAAHLLFAAFEVFLVG
ncbi:MAG TPA: hypothetical protein PKJ15_02265, partial [Methanomassiliicoccales archaeon]|nr:hypothetical protein [Methanomassiliicoccales archaeon]